MINLNNYEIWFLDYLEENLSDEQTQLLDTFLELHPNLKRELDDMSLIYLSPTPTIFNTKNLLKKELSPEHDTLDMNIAKFEGDLTQKEIKSLEQFKKQHSEKQEIERYIQKTRLVESKSIKYPFKENLHQNRYTLDEVDTLLLATLDGTISTFDKNWLSSHYSPEGLKKQLDSFRKIKFIPDDSIIFPLKESLKKRDAKIVFFSFKRKIITAAAIFLGLLIAFTWNQYDSIAVSKFDITAINDGIPNTTTSKIDAIEISKFTDTPTTINNDNQNRKSINSTLIVNNLSEKQKTHANTKSHSNTKRVVAVAEHPAIVTPSENNVTISYVDNSNPKRIPITDIYNLKPMKLKEISKTNISEYLAISASSMQFSKNHSKVSRVGSLQKTSHNADPIASISSDEEGDNYIDLGLATIEIPSLLVAGIDAVKSTKRAYDEAKNEKRNVYSFSLGGFSFYKSKRMN